MSRHALAHIDLGALRHNLSEVRRLAPGAAILAVIKADAYGHGITRVAEALATADGLAVARIDEARHLRDHGIQTRIVLLSESPDREALDYCSRQAIDLVIHNPETLALLHTYTPATPLRLWLKHDSGMHRLGLDATALAQAAQFAAAAPGVAEFNYMTHFSSADERDDGTTRAQLQRFDTALAELPPAPVSCANSAAIIRQVGIRQVRAQAQWVRPGLMLYGANPIDPAVCARYPVQLQPVMTLTAPVIALHTVAAGDGVGYNHRWIAPRDSVIATVAIGYGDGYPRHAGNGTPVEVAGQAAQLVGTVSMDMITVDVTDCRNVRVGDTATLWGGPVAAETVARHADTIPYQLFTGVTARVPRHYTG